MKKMIVATLAVAAVVWAAFEFQCDSLQAILKDVLTRRHIGAIANEFNLFAHIVNTQTPKNIFCLETARMMRRAK